jgi:hypothetical protein
LAGSLLLSLQLTDYPVSQELTGSHEPTLFLSHQIQCVWQTTACRGSMPVAGHKFYFVSKTPLPFVVLLCLLFLNTVLMLLLPNATGGALCWYEDNSITIQFILLALLAMVVFIFRKRVHWYGRK